VQEKYDFKAINWKTKPNSTATHQFFVKAHKARQSNPKKPSGRTLFVINVPPFISKKNLTQLFSPFGKVLDVHIQQTPSTGIPELPDPNFPTYKDLVLGHKVAYLVFKDMKSVAEIMEVDPDEIEPLVIRTALHCGLRSWIADYNSQIVDSQTLETSVKTFMGTFEKEELKRKEEEKNAGEPDDEGWVKISRKGKRAGTARTEIMQEKLKEKKRRWEKQLVNFTPTQMKETRANQLSELKKKFEEDKQRVALLKQQRKFKPF